MDKKTPESRHSTKLHELATPQLRYFSTFSGIGGFELGIHQAFPTAECVGYSEINQPAIKTYEEHFEHENYGDITTINPDELPDFDLIVGGFPCQAFSIAGHRKGFDDARGTLFFDIARILANKRPRHLVLENVKGLLSHDGGKTFSTILAILTDLGYFVEWQVLNSKYHGVPQNRERTYIVGHLGGLCGRQVFPLGANDGADQSPRGTAQEVSCTLRASTGGVDLDHQLITASKIISVGNVNPSGRGMNGNVISSDGLSSTLSTIKGEGLKVMVNEATSKGYAEAEVGDSIDVSIPNSKTRRGRVGKGIAKTLNTATGGDRTLVTLLSDARIRRLTPIECERLQAFPDGWTVGSDTQRYKQCGNAVTTFVVADVMKALKESCSL